jgi:putative phage-type endonuclease
MDPLTPNSPEVAPLVHRYQCAPDTFVGEYNTAHGGMECTEYRLAQRSEEWFRARSQCHVTASEAPAACGVGYVSRQQLAVQKATGIRPEPSQFAKEKMERGVRLEDDGAKAAAALFHRELLPGNFFVRKYASSEGEVVIGASPDGMLVPQGCGGDNPLVLEIKCPGCTEIGWTPPFPDCQRQKFWNYFVQVQVQLYCSGTARGILYVYTDDAQLKHHAFSISFWPRFFKEFIMREVYVLLRKVEELRTDAGARFPRRRESPLTTLDDFWADFVPSWAAVLL